MQSIQEYRLKGGPGRHRLLLNPPQHRCGGPSKTNAHSACKGVIMHTDLTLAATSLKRGQLQRLQDARGSLVLCLSGSLWLTQEGSLKDVVLEAGDEARIDHDGLSILSALADSSFVLSHDRAALDLLLRARQAQAALAAH
jgi:hypothetical protein